MYVARASTLAYELSSVSTVLHSSPNLPHLGVRLVSAVSRRKQCRNWSTSRRWLLCCKNALCVCVCVRACKVHTSCLWLIHCVLARTSMRFSSHVNLELDRVLALAHLVAHIHIGLHLQIPYDTNVGACTSWIVFIFSCTLCNVRPEMHVHVHVMHRLQSSVRIVASSGTSIYYDSVMISCSWSCNCNFRRNHYRLLNITHASKNVQGPRSQLFTLAAPVKSRCYSPLVVYLLLRCFAYPIPAVSIPSYDC